MSSTDLLCVFLSVCVSTAHVERHTSIYVGDLELSQRTCLTNLCQATSRYRVVLTIRLRRTNEANSKAWFFFYKSPSNCFTATSISIFLSHAIFFWNTAVYVGAIRIITTSPWNADGLCSSVCQNRAGALYFISVTKWLLSSLKKSIAQFEISQRIMSMCADLFS